MASNRCIKNLLKLICLLQENSEDNCSLDDSCSKPFLGPNVNCICFNTRVINLFTKNGNLLTATYLDKNNVEQSSSLFRVTKIKDDCCTLLILNKENDDFLSTNQSITVNLKCICAIKCVTDAVVENL